MAAVETVSDEDDRKSGDVSVLKDGKVHEGSSVATVIARRASSSGIVGLKLLYGVDWPFFHVDLLDAVDAAVRDAMNDEGLML